MRKGRNSFILSLAKDKKLVKLGSLAIVRQLVYRKENLDFKSAVFHFKMDVVSHPACGE